jgi:hypothetical protein
MASAGDRSLPAEERRFVVDDFMSLYPSHPPLPPGDRSPAAEERGSAASGLPMSATTLLELWRGTLERVDDGGAGIARVRELLGGRPVDNGRRGFIPMPTDLRMGAREEAPSAAFLLNNPQARPPPEPAGGPAPAAALGAPWGAAFEAVAVATWGAPVDAASGADAGPPAPEADAGPPALVRP